MTPMADQLPVLLLPASAEDVFPDLSRPLRRLGWQLLAAVSVGAVAAMVWPFHETVRASGLVRPSGENTQVQTLLGGSVERVSVQANQQVRAGQVLAVLDTRALQDQRRQLRDELATLERQRLQSDQRRVALASQLAALQQLNRAALSSSKRSVDQARAMLVFSRSEWTRYSQLQRSGAVPRSLVDEKQVRNLVSAAELQRAVQGVAEQQARGLHELARLREYLAQVQAAAEDQTRQVADRRTRLQEVERQLAQSLIRAPLAGSVVSTSLRHRQQVVRPGEVVASIAPAGRPFEVKLAVSDRQVSQLRAGQRATLQVLGCSRAEFGVLPAVVQAISADTLSPGRYEVSLRPEATRLSRGGRFCNLRQGMEVSGDVMTRHTTFGRFLLNKLQPAG
ncbi:MAG: HlyD family efflux transporter periplasmic adaptor subunit [Synechococcaceae bacterium WB9_2_112]|nr:HlyD family efflux transporter periplasmic adaptor subunit [Synechococcaceae bacterium WB9_2_112]